MLSLFCEETGNIHERFASFIEGYIHFNKIRGLSNLKGA